MTVKLKRVGLRMVLVMLLAGAGVRASGQSVRKVDFSEAPEMKELGQRAQRLGNELYPKILALRAAGASNSPQDFEIVFRKRIESDDAGFGLVRGRLIYLSAEYFGENPGDLDWYLAHEMAHVAQRYRGATPWYWREGMADYVRYKLGYTNDWRCPGCAAQYPHYTSGYSCAAALLMYVDARFGSNVVRQLDAELSRGTYAEAFFEKTTGRSLSNLWADFQKTPAFTPLAAEINMDRAAFGYVNGRPPRDAAAKYQDYLEKKPAGPLTLEAIEYLKSHDQTPKDSEKRLDAFLKKQPSGWLFLDGAGYIWTLAEYGRLPGFARREHGEVDYMLNTFKMASKESYPFTQTYNVKKKGSDSAYHYALVRATRNGPWRLQRAWRTGPGGQTVEEYSVQ